MYTRKKLLALAVSSLFVSNVYAADFSFVGNLSNINAVQVLDFKVEHQSDVELVTYSYAGGTNSAEQRISSGGFDIVVSVVGPDGTIIARDDDSREVVDPSTGNAYDAQLLQTLDAGEYQAVVSYFNNMPEVGEDANSPDTFPGSNGETSIGRTDAYAVDILEVDFASLGDEFIATGGSHVPVPPATEEQIQESIVETTSQSILKSQTSTTIGVVNSHFKQLRSSNTGQFSAQNANYAPSTGLNAGDGVSGMAIWFTPTYSHLNNTQSVNHDRRYEEEDTSYLAGIDYVINTNVVVGGMLGYEKSTTDLNNGGDTEKDGVVGSAYGAYNVSGKATLYALVGYGDLDNDIKDYASGSAIKGDFDSDKLFFSLGGLYYTQYNDYNMTLDGGYSWAKEEMDSYTNSAGSKIRPDDTDLRMLTANLEVAKPYGWGEVFVNGGIEIDLSPSISDDAQLLEGDEGFGALVGGGVRFNTSDNLFAELAAGYNVLRKYEYGGHTVTATLRYEF